MQEMLHEKFIYNYAEYLGWKTKNYDKILIKLCEEYWYSPEDRSRKFLTIAFGWLWGNSNNDILANSEVFLLELDLKKAYEKVAKKNSWD